MAREGLCNPTWLRRMHDSAVQVRMVLEENEIPKPLRLAEAVIMEMVHERAWTHETNGFFVDGEEIEDVLSGGLDDVVFEHCDPSPIGREWFPESSQFHPFRWWEKFRRTPV